MCMYINTSIHWPVLCYGTLKIDALLLIQCKGCVQMVKILYQDMQPYKTKWGSFALEMSCWMTTKEMKLLFSCHLLRCASYQCLWRLSSTASKLQTFFILLYKRLALSNLTIYVIRCVWWFRFILIYVKKIRISILFIIGIKAMCIGNHIKAKTSE